MLRFLPRTGLIAAALCSSGAFAADPSADYFVYVTNELSNDLSIIDPRTDEVIATVDVGRRPRGVRVTADGGYVFVALSGSPRCPPTLPDEQCAQMTADKSQDGIAVVDAATRAVVRVLPGGSDPEQFDISPDATRLFVANEDADAASIVDIDSATLIRTVSVGREPEGVKASPDGSVFVVTSESDHNVTVIDAKEGVELTRVDVGLRPRDVIFSSDGTRAFVSAELARHITVLETRSWTVAEQIAVSDTALPMGLAVTADTQRLFVANGRAGSLAAIDLNTASVAASVDVGARPWGIALSPDQRFVYTANGPSNDVTVVDAASMTLVARIAAGESPWGVAVGPRPNTRGNQ